MKKLIAIGLLLLLLYNMFGLTVTVLFFEKEYQNASPITKNDQWKTVKVPIPTLPYNTTWETPDEEEGLIQEGAQFYNVIKRHHENDTLYITLKTNQEAQRHFVELADQIQQLMDLSNSSTQSPFNKALKFLYELTKIYLSQPSFLWNSPILTSVFLGSVYEEPNQILLHCFYSISTPPPEQNPQ